MSARLLLDEDVRVAATLPAPGTLPAAALRERALRVGGWLRAQGVAPGDRVAIQLENGMDLIDAHLGCIAAGAIRVPLNAHYRQAELAPILQDASPALAIARDAAPYPRGTRVCATVGADSPLADPAPDLDLALGLDPGARARVLEGDPLGARATAWLFTSGTTGRPKGVPQTWAMWTHNLHAIEQRWALTPDDVLWNMLPLFHTHGLVLGLHGTLLRGAKMRLSSRFEPRDPPEGVTHVYGVPTFYRRWLPTMTRAAWGRLRLVVSGSDGLPAELSDAIHAACGHRVLERYGMTETVMIASNPFHGERRAGTVGTALDGVELRVRDGEVQLRGPNVFAGYHPRPDPTAFTEDGYFRTGDAGAFDEAGYLRIVGRKKDLVIVGGVNVSPAEVEVVLARAPGVAEVACCGLPDVDLNEVVAAAVVADGTLPEHEVRANLARAAQDLSGLKRPRDVRFVDALPRNALGKVQRARVRTEVFGV